MQSVSEQDKNESGHEETLHEGSSDGGDGCEDTHLGHHWKPESVCNKRSGVLRLTLLGALYPFFKFNFSN